MRNKKNFLITVFLLVVLVLLTGCGKAENLDKPIEGFTEFMDLFVYPMAGIMWVIGKTIGFGSYPVTIIIATIVVRTIAWPIYGKTNDMQLKMQLVQPEMEKIQKKYAGREDQESKQRMSMETMQLYKKYGIGFGGCLMPFVQMPIFLGFYRTISRMPYSIAAENNWIGKVFTTTELFGVDMVLKQNQGFNDAFEIIETTTWTTQKWGVVVLAALVGITQFVSILISNQRQKKQQEKQYSSIPEYRRPQQNDQQKMTANTMKFMLYFMAAMMVVFVWGSAAGLGLYWVVGNIYSTLQIHYHEIYDLIHSKDHTTLQLVVLFL
jgi:YidC/Oxa1 family membrane protein insertase